MIAPRVEQEGNNVCWREVLRTAGRPNLDSGARPEEDGFGNVLSRSVVYFHSHQLVDHITI